MILNIWNDDEIIKSIYILILYKYIYEEIIEKLYQFVRNRKFDKNLIIYRAYYIVIFLIKSNNTLKWVVRMQSHVSVVLRH